ncbi:MAG: chemotaxis-specific protein-glutamate methyltransferase CheB [Planctomycetia bacterium]
MRIGIVNDVRAACEALRRVVDSLPDHEIAWMAADGVEAVAMAKRDRPDLILMDLIMPHLDGVQATRQIMASAPCAILVVTATVSGNISLVYEAMGFGALDAVDTPMLGPAGEVSGAGALVEKIGMIAKIVGSSEPRRTARPAAPAAPPKLVAVGASTGGPKAISDLLLPLPHDWNVAVLVVQHVDVAFSQGLAKWLSDRTNRAVRVAEHGQQPAAGDVLLAGTNDHLVLSKARTLEYREEPREVFFRPSVDVFFESVADHWPQTGAALLLTGMGKDGAKGLLKLRSRGWHTMAQDEASSVVWSMPKAGIDLGAACEVLTVDQMARSLVARMAV